METIFEKAGITYTLAEDGMYYPDLKLPEDEAPHYGKYGRMRKAFLQEHRQGLYMELLMNGKLVKHLNAVDDEANGQVEFIICQMALNKQSPKFLYLRSKKNDSVSMNISDLECLQSINWLVFTSIAKS